MSQRSHDPAEKRPLLLLVEDHRDSREMYAEFLRDEFDVLEAGDGVAALAIIEQSRPDVVVTDLALPRMDGFEMIRRIRADERCRATGIIALSGYSAREFTDRARQAGVDAILEKPCLPEALARAVAALASGRKG